MEEEGIEQQILLSPEFAVVGAVYSVNGYTGHVVLKTSDLENDSGYQTASDIDSAINEHNEDEFAHPYLQTLIGTKQDELTPGVNINISPDNVISATDTRYSAGNGININGENAISVDTTVVATQQNLANEVTNRENADNALQAQIDGISASSDVVDIVGTYAELQQYDTQHLKDNDIVKVLQDETQGGATTYYRWSTSTSTFTLIGQEGPYYTKAAADSQFVPQTRTVNGKALSSNITLNASDVSALGTSDVVQTTGSSTSQVMSQNAVTTQLNTKLNASDYVVDTQLADSSNPVQNRVINNLLGDMPADFFSAGETVSGEGTDITLNNTISAPLESVELDGDTYQQTYSGKNLIDNTDLTFDFSNVSSSYIQLSTLPTGIRYKTTYSSSGTPLIMFKLPIDLTQHTGKVIRMKANFGEKGRFVISVTNDDLSSRGTVASSSSSGETITWTVPDDLQGRNWLAYSFSIQNPGGDYTVDFTDLVMTIDNADMSWEPYVGGTASPNPDYPQDVQVVTGEQMVEVHGKNLLDNYHPTEVVQTASWQPTETGGLISNTANWGNSVNWKFVGDVGSTYQLQASVTSGDAYLYVNTYTDNTYTTAKTTLLSSLTGNISSSFVPDSPYIRIRIAKGSAMSNVPITNFMVEKSLTATAYEPYQGNNYTVDLGSTELCKIGDYQDYIYKSGDDWYVHKAIGKATIDGTEDWELKDSGTTGWYYLANIRSKIHPIFVQPSDQMQPWALCDYYLNKNIAAANTNVGFNMITSSTNTNIRIRNKTEDTVSNFENWLSSHNLTIYAPLATPTDTKITDSTLIGQLEALYNAKTNLGTTSIVTTTTGTNLPVILDIVAYRKSLAGMLGAIERLSE